MKAKGQRCAIVAAMLRCDLLDYLEFNRVPEGPNSCPPLFCTVKYFYVASTRYKKSVGFNVKYGSRVNPVYCTPPSSGPISVKCAPSQGSPPWNTLYHVWGVADT